MAMEGHSTNGVALIGYRLTGVYYHSTRVHTKEHRSIRRSDAVIHTLPSSAGPIAFADTANTRFQYSLLRRSADHGYSLSYWPHCNEPRALFQWFKIMFYLILYIKCLTICAHISLR